MFEYIKECLVNNDGEEDQGFNFPFRKRSEHIKRIFMWTKRLIDGISNINKEAILVSAIFL